MKSEVEGATAEYLAAQSEMAEAIRTLADDDLEALGRQGMGAGPARDFTQRAARQELARRAVSAVSAGLEPVLARVEKAQQRTAELAAQLTAPRPPRPHVPPPASDARTLDRIAASLEKIANPAAPGPVAVQKHQDGSVSLLRGAEAVEFLASHDRPDAPEGSPLARARTRSTTT